MYRYKTIRSPPITDNVKFELKDETIILGVIVTGWTVLSTETKIIDILKKIIRSGDLCMPWYEVYLEMYSGVHI